MDVLVELLAFSAGGLVALVASRWMLNGVLDLTFRPIRPLAARPQEGGGSVRIEPSGAVIRTPTSSSTASSA
jgi:hypothetical protein